MTGLLVLALVLVVATSFGLWRRRRDGVVSDVTDVTATAAGGSGVDRLGSDELGVDLGSRATLVQFSSAFCQPCRAARATLSHVARTVDGVVHVEIDAEHRLDLVRRMNIFRTPTTLVVDSAGRVVGRATGAPRLAEVHAALPG